MALTYRQLLNTIVKSVPFKDLDQEVRISHCFERYLGFGVEVIPNESLAKRDSYELQIDKDKEGHVIFLWYGDK